MEKRDGRALGHKTLEEVRIRAVQDLSASEAVGFVFLLKQAVRDVLPGKHGLSGLHDRIDRLTLEAFDRFVACREKIYELRMREVRNRTLALERLMAGGTEQRDGPPSDTWRTKPAEDG